MADEKTFKTQFLIGAKWVGGAGVQAAQRGLTLLERHAQRGRHAFRGMTASVFKGVAAYDLARRTVGAYTNVLIKSFAAATEAQEAHDELGLSIERMSKRYKNTMGKSVAETSRIVEESTQALIKASEQMEETGHDAETLQKGWAKLAATGALDPQQILAQRDAFSDVLSYVAGANATAEESAQLGEAWADAILRGNIALLKQMDLTDGEIELLKNVNKMVKKGTITGEEGIKRRQDLVLKFAKKFEGETKRVFDRPTGKIKQMWIQVGNVFENLGQPFIDRAPEMSETFAQLANDIKPTADELAKITAEGLKGISGWFKEHKEDIPVWLDDLTRRLKGIYDLLMLINKVPVLFDLPAAIKRWMAPARMGQLPGAPNQVVNPALQQGKAGQRYLEGVKKQQEKAEQEKAKAAPHKYMPYLRDLQSASAQTAAAKAQAAPSGGGGTTVTAALKAERARVGAELAGNPETQRLLAASVLAEMGDQSAAAQQQYMETVMNRAAAEGRSLHAVLSDPKYYPKATKDRLSRKISPQEAEQMQSMATDVLGGSNLANFATGNESLNVGYKSRARGIWMPILARALGKGGYERFVGEPHTKEWVERLQKIATTEKAQPEGPTVKAAEALAKQVPTAKASDDAVQSTKMIKGPPEANTHPGGVKYKGKGITPAPPNVSMEDAMMRLPGGPGSGLNRLIKDMNLNQRMGGAAGGQNVAFNNNINVNGVAPGREALMAKKTALALRDPVQEGLRQLKEMKAQSARVGYV